MDELEIQAEAESPTEAPIAPELSADELLAGNEATPAESSSEEARLKAVLEALVYVTEEPLTAAQISGALQIPEAQVRELLDKLVADFDKPDRGIHIKEVAGGFKMATKPEHHEAVRNFAKSLKPPLKLSLPALETLAVIAYKQPVTGPEIMEIRGVQGGGVLKTLLDRKLIAVAGRKNVIGKPMLYKTTREFLLQFGLKDLTELPSLKEFEEIRRMAFSDEPQAPAPSAAALAAETPAAEVPPAEPPPAESALKTVADETTPLDRTAEAAEMAPVEIESPVASTEAETVSEQPQASEESSEDLASAGGSAVVAVPFEPDSPAASTEEETAGEPPDEVAVGAIAETPAENASDGEAAEQPGTAGQKP